MSVYPSYQKSNGTIHYRCVSLEELVVDIFVDVNSGPGVTRLTYRSNPKKSAIVIDIQNITRVPKFM